jgi:hypothetical protein
LPQRIPTHAAATWLRNVRGAGIVAEIADTGTAVTRAPCLPDLTSTLGAMLPVFRRNIQLPSSDSFRKDK